MLRDLARWLIGLPRTVDPPEGVHIHWPDGTSQEVPVIYLGEDRTGIHQWEGVIDWHPEYLEQRYDGEWTPAVRVDRMPALTEIRFTICSPPDTIR